MRKIIFLLLIGFSLHASAQKKPHLVPLQGGNIAKANPNVDSLRKQLFLANYKLARVKYYLHICIKHPKQTKFLTSWISRAIQ